MDHGRPFISTKRTHVILALVFLVVMLVEWGSHSLAFAHSGYPRGMVAINAQEPEHDDPFHTLTVCCESSKNGGGVVSPAHHLPSYNSYVELYEPVPSFTREFTFPQALRDDARRIFRPKDPLLHPPELSLSA